VKINFTKKPNFWHIASVARNKNVNDYEILNQAFEQGVFEEENKIFLKKFIDWFKNVKNIKSQLYQDVFASFVIGNQFDKTFLEFGATDGLELSNSFMLENTLNWSGVLSEPSPQWHEVLKENRQYTKIIKKCIWSESGKILDFFMSDRGNFSTLNEFIDSDKYSMPLNTESRKKAGKLITVETISLNDVIKEYFNNTSPSYISIDTEGSEFKILESFNFKKYRPKVFTVEHNFTELQNKIDELMVSKNYERIFRKLTSFDAWYVSKEALNELDL
tara:strand:- start:618 stop:1442 length:825 start_codon:yes stop_codon:yes gene_type:complete